VINYTLGVDIAPSPSASPDEVRRAVMDLVALDEASPWHQDEGLRRLLLDTVSSTTTMRLTLRPPTCPDGRAARGSSADPGQLELNFSDPSGSATQGDTG
jgi:hypothetical protein